MKKYRILFALVVIFTAVIIVPATAQKKSNVGTYIQKYLWGPKIGLNIAKLGGDETRQGLVLGVFGEYKPDKTMGYSAELLYSQQGASTRINGQDVSINVDYLNIPVLANWYFGGLGLKVGLQLGIPINNTIKIGETSYEDFFGKAYWDIAIPIGMSYNFDFGIKIDARYNFGVNKVWEDYNDKNSVIQLTIGYIF
jgi:hypothetical protein